VDGVMCIKKQKIKSSHRRYSNIQDEVIVKQIGCSKQVILNRPDKLNSLNLNMVRMLTPLYLSWNNDPSVGNIVMTGEGGKAFCAGGDIVAITKDKNLGVNFFKEEFILNNLIGTIKKPHIAIIDGITMGGGVGLSVHGKFRVATEKSLFAMPETGIGYFCDVGGTHFLPRLRNNLGMYLGLSGARLKGYDVFKSGVATHYIPSNHVSDLKSALASAEYNTYDEINSIINQFSVKTALESEIDSHLIKINDIFGSNSLNEIFQKLEKDPSEWSQKLLQKLLSVSPTSLQVVFKQLKLGANLNLGECLKLEYKISQEFMRNNDFFEGVNSLLVRKDGKPNWSPKTINEVKQESVNKYFTSPEELPLVNHRQ
jgi:3-hydroxyisobutyryl-CoA hydrolase